MELLLFLLVNGIIWGCVYGLIAVSFAIIFSTTGLFHFAHGATFVLGVYITHFWLSRGLHIVLAVAIAMVVCSLVGMGLELAVYRPLRRRGTSRMVILSASIGVLFFAQNVIAIVFSTDQLFLAPQLGRETFRLGPVIVTALHIGIVAVSLAFFAAIYLYLRFTKMGTAIRAMANNQEMAEVVGIDLGRVYLTVFAIGSALAAPAGVMLALMASFNPYMGAQAILLGAVATIVGGMGSIVGAMPAAMLLGVAENVGIWQIPTAWKPAISFGIIMLFIIFRPTGFFGLKTSKTGV